jgi:hypothetical protein
MSLSSSSLRSTSAAAAGLASRGVRVRLHHRVAQTDLLRGDDLHGLDRPSSTAISITPSATVCAGR